jgi:hypothetical protein
MRNSNRSFAALFFGGTSKPESKRRPSHLLLGLSVVAALLSFGCPQSDPMQAFNDPKTTTANPNNPNNQAPAPVPEPASALLFGVALLIGGGILRRRQNRGTQR